MTFEIRKVYVKRKLQVVVFLRKGHSLGLRQLAIVLLHQGSVNMDFSRLKCRSSDKIESRIPNKFASKPQEGLLKVVVGLGGYFEVLKVFLPVESHGGGLDFPLFDVDLISAQHDWDVFTDTLKVAMPIGNVLIGDARRDIKHDDTALALDVVAIAKTTKLFLAGGIPDIKNDRAKVGREG